jgi:hypothetical protein
MNIFSRLFGKKSKLQQADEALIENPNIQAPLALSIVFKGQFYLDQDNLLKQLRSIDSSMKNIRCQMPYGKLDDGCYALFGWKNHVIKLIGINAPYPADVLEICVTPAHYSQDIKDQVRENDSYIILYYTGYEKNILEQYLALTRFAASFEPFNGLALINGKGHSSLPIKVIRQLATEKGGIEGLCHCLPMFYCGFVKYEIENVKGVWMRTYGADAFGLPDFAVLANSHDEGVYYFDMFSNILQYLRDSGTTMASGDTMEVGDNKMMSLRTPRDDESFLKDEGYVLVVEINSNNATE